MTFPDPRPAASTRRTVPPWLALTLLAAVTAVTASCAPGATDEPTPTPTPSASGAVDAVPLALEGDWLVDWTVTISDTTYPGYQVGAASSRAWRFEGVSCESEEACVIQEFATAMTFEDLDAGAGISDFSALSYDLDSGLVNFEYPTEKPVPCFDASGAVVADQGNELEGLFAELTADSSGGWTVLYHTILRTDVDNPGCADHPDYVVWFEGTLTRR